MCRIIDIFTQQGNNSNENLAKDHSSVSVSQSPQKNVTPPLNLIKYRFGE